MWLIFPACQVTTDVAKSSIGCKFQSRCDVRGRPEASKGTPGDAKCVTEILGWHNNKEVRTRNTLSILISKLSRGDIS